MRFRKYLIVLLLLGLLFWGITVLLFVATPVFIVDLLPDILPLSVFAFLLFLIGLILLTTCSLALARTRSPNRTWVVILASASLIVLYNLTPLAPAWSCWGKRLYLINAKAGQNCTLVCTNNKRKPCSGWSSCWDKNVSCSSSGRDQDGRGCSGCCFSCDIVCVEDPPPPPPDDDPPTVSGSVDCSQTGNNGWCIGTASLDLSASDPQNYVLTISGTIGGAPFSCSPGNNCVIALPEGSGSITYKVTAAASGLSSSVSSTAWQRDSTAPVVNPVYPSANGSNGWHITSPIAISASGSDSTSGLASAQISVNGGVWQTNSALLDGIYAVDFLAIDNAGNSTAVSRTIQIDTTPPTVTPILPIPDGLKDWFVTGPVNIAVDGSDAGSGLGSVLVSVNEGEWRPDASLNDGLYSVRFKSIDIAGNQTTATRTVKIDTVPPLFSNTISGVTGSAGWYTSPTSTSISASDETSGVDRIEYNQNNTGWQLGNSVVSNDGVNKIDVMVFDIAGNMSSDSLEIKVDTGKPSLSTSVTGVEGRGGWYTSQTTTTIASFDAVSGINWIAYNQNGTGWQTGSSFVSADGVNRIDVQVLDVAGNMSNSSLEIKVDTAAPASQFSTPANGSIETLVRGTYLLSGISVDATSGVSSAEILLDGKSWLPLVLDSENSWTYSWNTLGWADGAYPVKVRAMDVAGNQEVPSSEAGATLLVNNTPPHIKLTPEWLIWQSGSLLIETEYFPVKEGSIVISDSRHRWQPVRIPFGKKYPSQIKWDRRFTDGVLAPSGDYRVTVSACNIFDLCSEEKATIKIPWYSIVVPTQSIPTEMVEVEQEPKSQVEIPPATVIPPLLSVPMANPEISAVSKTGTKSGQSLLVFMILIALMLAISCAALADGRPLAIRAIATTINLQNHKGETEYE